MIDAMSDSSAASANTIVVTRQGALQGAAVDGAMRFYDIPYAAPPVGALRFVAPQPHAPWEGVRDATKLGPVAPQLMPTPEEFERAMPGLDITPLVGTGWSGGDHFLALNIWTPNPQAQGLAVMVFIHGGSFTGGAGNAPVYDGAAFARNGVVLVSINYRLGVEGFLPIPGAPTNLGLRDQLAALAWVRDNIAAFGGDPGNVTVFGESAGAMSVANLIASPLAKGLFRRAIVQSGHGSMVREIPVAARLTKHLAKMLRIKPTLEGFRGASVEACLKALAKVSQPTTRIDLRGADKREPAFGLSRFLPVIGDDVLPEHPLKALANGAGAEVDLLIGTNREEMNLYFVPSGVHRKIGRFLANFVVRRAEPKAKDILIAYGIKQRGKLPGAAFTEALTDLVFRLPARWFAAAHRGRTHVYEFGYRSTAYKGELGACHGLELPFVFNTLDTVSGPKGLAPDAPRALADRLNTLWSDFAKTGALPWPHYEASTGVVCALETGVAETEPEMPASRFLP